MIQLGDKTKLTAEVEKKLVEIGGTDATQTFTTQSLSDALVHSILEMPPALDQAIIKALGLEAELEAKNAAFDTMSDAQRRAIYDDANAHLKSIGSPYQFVYDETQGMFSVQPPPAYERLRQREDRDDE